MSERKLPAFKIAQSIDDKDTEMRRDGSEGDGLKIHISGNNNEVNYYASANSDRNNLWMLSVDENCVFYGYWYVCVISCYGEEDNACNDVIDIYAVVGS